MAAQQHCTKLSFKTSFPVQPKNVQLLPISCHRLVKYQPKLGPKLIMRMVNVWRIHGKGFTL